LTVTVQEDKVVMPTFQTPNDLYVTTIWQCHRWWH